MPGISILAQYFSRILFLTLYALDVYFAYLLVENESITTITAFGLILVLFIGSKVNLITLKVIPLRKCRSLDSERLIRCLDEVAYHGEQSGVRTELEAILNTVFDTHRNYCSSRDFSVRNFIQKVPNGSKLFIIYEFGNKESSKDNTSVAELDDARGTVIIK